MPASVTVIFRIIEPTQFKGKKGLRNASIDHRDQFFLLFVLVKTFNIQCQALLRSSDIPCLVARLYFATCCEIRYRY